MKVKKRLERQSARKGPLHMSDMVVAGNNCMVDHVQAAGDNASSRLKLNTIKLSTSLHSPVPLPSSKASFASQTMRARTAMGVFKEERNTLVTDLTQLWKQIDFLEVQLAKANKKNLNQSAKHANIVEKLAAMARDYHDDNERLQREALVDADAINDLSRQITFAKAEQRRLHHLANTKQLDAHKTERKFAQKAANKLSRLNLTKNASDARGDELASKIVDMRRSFQQKEGELLNEVTELKSIVTQLRAEVVTNEQVRELRRRYS